MIKTTDERFKGQGEVPETHLRGELQVDLNQLPSKLSLLPGVLKLRGQLGELGHRGMPLPPKNVPELTLPGILEDEPRLRWVLKVGPL